MWCGGVPYGKCVVNGVYSLLPSPLPSNNRYVRGTNLKPNMPVHIPGAGDFIIDTITALPDPCPLPGTETDGDGEVVEGKKIRRHLNDKETLLYAPMSNIGNVIFDKGTCTGD